MMLVNGTSGDGTRKSYKVIRNFESAYWFYKMRNETKYTYVPEWWNCDILSPCQLIMLNNREDLTKKKNPARSKTKRYFNLKIVAATIVEGSTLNLQILYSRWNLCNFESQSTEVKRLEWPLQIPISEEVDIKKGKNAEKQNKRGKGMSLSKSTNRTIHDIGEYQLPDSAWTNNEQQWNQARQIQYSK